MTYSLLLKGDRDARRRLNIDAGRRRHDMTKKQTIHCDVTAAPPSANWKQQRKKPLTTGLDRDSIRFSRLRHARKACTSDPKVAISNNTTPKQHSRSPWIFLLRRHQQFVAEVVTQELNTRWQHSLTILVEYAFIPWRA
ncbi:hypothetical protein TNCV_2320651 [Trichonephila clavipes]|nr:hypothetical protein TNCV_2320651 [Trichonephila clavipes]